jgi:hypothetical protein
MINLQSKILFQYVQPVQRTANYWNFSKSKGHNSVKNGLIIPKTELDLNILMINLYTKFHFSMYNQGKENERTMQIIGIFQSPWGITESVKNDSTVPKKEVDLDILVINVYSKLHLNM